MVPFYTGEESYVEFKVGSRTFLGWVKLPPYKLLLLQHIHIFKLGDKEALANPSAQIQLEANFPYFKCPIIWPSNKFF